MDKLIVVKIPLLVELTSYSTSIAASTGSDSFLITEAVATKLKSHIDSILTSFGFIVDPRFRGQSHIVPQRDGCSLYDYYLFYSDNGVIKVIIDLRVANHKAKPSFEANKQNAEHKVKTNLSVLDISDAQVEYLDVVFKKHDWGLQYFVGGTSDYMQPVDNINQLDSILYGKISKILEKHS